MDHGWIDEVLFGEAPYNKLYYLTAEPDLPVPAVDVTVDLTYFYTQEPAWTLDELFTYELGDAINLQLKELLCE